MMIYYTYPLLLCLLPVHCVFGQNIGEIPLKKYYEALIWTAIVVIAGCAVMNFFIRDLFLSELIFCFNFFLILYGNYAFINFFSEYKRSLVKNKILFTTAYFLFGIFVSLIIYFFAKHTFITVLSKILFYALLLLNFFVVADILNRVSKFSPKNTKKVDKNKSSKDFPDIYHIMVDTHSGFYNKDFCDEAFKKGLIQRDFHIYENAKSNYNYTYVSLPSMFNMDYLYNIFSKDKHYCDSDESLAKYANNKVFDELKQRGYIFNFVLDKNFIDLHRKNYIGKNDFINSDENLRNDILRTFLFSSIFKYFVQKSVDNNNLEKNVLSLFNIYKKISTDKKSNPVYNYLHVLAPHHPFYVDENGKKHSHENYTNQKYFAGYQKYIDREILSLIDDIKSNMKENSVIIVHSDHCLNEQADLNNTYHILMAIYFPEKYTAGKIPDNCTLVNLFRYIFNMFFEESYPILDNEFYKTAYPEFEKLDENVIKD